MAKRACFIFLPILLTITVLSFLFYHYERVTILKFLQQKERVIIKTGRQLVYNEITPVVDDMVFLRLQTESVMQNDSIHNLEQSLSELRSTYFNFSRSHPIYDQVRFIGTNGMELVRVNNSHMMPEIVPDNQLQDKSQRYYFRDVIKLEPPTIFLSPLDLNIEQGKIELPYKPMLRLGAVVEKNNGTKAGAVVLNYKAQKLLDRLHVWAMEQTGTMMLVNRDGYWLHGKSVQDEWGFMFPERQNVRFQTSEKELWENVIVRQDSGQQFGHDGFYTFETIYPLKSTFVSSTGSGSAYGKSMNIIKNDDYFWKIISHVDRNTIALSLRPTRVKILSLDLLLVLVSALFAVLLARAQSKRLESDQALRKSHEQLEETVAQRTDELSQRNKQLSEEIESRKQAEEARASSDKRYRAIMDSMEDGVYICSPDYILRYVNPSLDRRIGTECEGKICYETLYNRNSSCPWCVLDRVLAGEHVAYELKSPNSANIYHISNSPIQYQEGEVGKLTITRDITDYRQTQRALAKSEREYITLLETMREGLMVVNLDGIIMHCNSQFAAMLGYSVEQLIHRSSMELVDEDYRVLLAAELEKRKENIAVPYEMQWRRVDGTKILTSVSPAFWRDEQGLILGSFGLITDITMEREAERKRRSLENQLQQAQKMEALGTLAGGIAHDFNNILSAILGFAELANETVESESPVAKDIDHILKAGKRAANLVKQILAFSRQADQGKQTMEIVPIVKEAMKFIKAATSSSVSINVTAGDGIGSIYANPTQIHQIVMNLVTNACQAMSKDGGRVAVIVERIAHAEARLHPLRDHDGDVICLTVSDTGPGIEPQWQEKIFEPFFTTKELGKGTGLGLSMVQTIVEDLKGKIEVQSSKEGTTFRIFLPIITEPEEQIPTVSESLIRGNGEQVVWVDDEKPIVTLGCRTLESLGYTAIGCTSAGQCIEKIRQDEGAIQLVITDYNMPEMNGLQMIRTIRSMRSDIPFIVCSGFSEEINEENAQSLGVEHFLMKPVGKNDIAVSVFATLQKRMASPVEDS